MNMTKWQDFIRSKRVNKQLKLSHKLSQNNICSILIKYTVYYNEILQTELQNN